MTDQATAVQTITPAFDKTVDVKEMKFRFKKDKMGNQRPSLSLNVPVPSIEGIVAIIEKGGKGLELLQEAIYYTVRDTLAGDVGDDEAFSQEKLDAEILKYTWDGIANRPREDRRSSTISKEDWEAFGKDYVAVMPGLTGKKEDAIALAVTVYLKKFSNVKTDKKILALLKDQLAIYASTSGAEQFSEILELLLRKVDTYLTAEDPALLLQNL